MITGETEHILAPYQDEDYDDFFGRRRRKKRKQQRALRHSRRLERRKMRQSKPIRISRKAKRQRFFKGVGQVYNDLGRARGIGTAIDSLTRPRSQMVTPEARDFEMSLGENTSDLPTNKPLPVGLIVLGGVALVGIVGLVAAQSQKHKTYR